MDSFGKPPFVLALDIGTSSVRGLLFDRHCIEVEAVRSRRQYTVHSTAGGGSEVDADFLFGLLCECIDETLAKAAGHYTPVAAVAPTSMATTMLAVGGNGSPLTKVMTYADSRSQRYALEAGQLCDENVLYDRTGCPLHATYWPARFVWLQKTRRQLISDTSRWMTFGSYCMFKWFGRDSVSFSDASWTGLLDRRTRDWYAPVLAALKVPLKKLPELAGDNQPCTGLTADYAGRWPALSSARWFTAIGDGAAAAAGCGVQGSIAISVGTSSAVRMIVSGTPEIIPRGLWCYRIDAKRSLIGGALTEGGNVFAWVNRFAQNNPHASLEAEAAALLPAAHGLTFLPMLAGERSPGWNAGMRGAVMGLSLSTTPAHFLRAAMEGVAFRLAGIYRLLGAFHSGDSRIVAGGGAMVHSPAWLQIIADTLGKPVYLSSAEEVSARGAALCALESLGIVPDPGSYPAVNPTPCLPDPECHEIYKKEMIRQERLYTAIQSLSE